MKKSVPMIGVCRVLNMVASTVSLVVAAEPVTLQFTAKGGPYAGQQDQSGSYYWSDKEAPHPNADYLIPSGREMGVKTTEGSTAFAGDSLTVAGTLSYVGGYGATFTLGKPVTFASGTKFYFESYHFTVTANPFVIEGSASKPVSFYLSRGGENNDYYFPSRFESAAGGVVEYAAGKTPVETRVARVWLQNSDFSKYDGTVRFAYGAGAYSTEALAIAGTLEIGTNSILTIGKTTGESSFGTLVFRKGSRLALAANNRHLIKVSQKLEIEDDVSFDLQKFSGFVTGTPPDVPVFELTAAAVAASGDLQALLSRVILPISPAASLPNFKWTFADAANGGKIIGISHREIVQMVKSMGYGNDAFRLDKGEMEACSYWTDSRYPHENADYYLYANTAYAYYTNGPEQYVFPGGSLVINATFGLYNNVRDFSANFVFLGGLAFQGQTAGADYHLRGHVKISPYTKTSQAETFLGETTCAYNFNIADHGSLTLDADISGSGLLGFGMYTAKDNPTKNDTVGSVSLCGDNSDYDGKIVVSCWQTDTLPAKFQAAFSDAPFTPGPVSNLTLCVAGATSLGGARKSFADDALTLNNECRLAFTESVVFSEPTRGWYFPQKAYVRVPDGCAATVKQALKFGPTASLVKEGLGRLVLGGTVAVEDGGVSRPTLLVSEGQLGYASATALNGISVGFAPGTALVVDAKTVDETLRATGLMVDDATFGTVGEIPVTFDVGNDFGKDDSATVALMTAADAALAESLMSRLSVGRVKGHRVTVSLVTNADSSVSLVGTIEPSGLMIFVR